MIQAAFDFDPPCGRLAYQGATPTAIDCSRAAAAQAQPTAASQRARYEAWLRSRGTRGGTDAEATAALTIPRHVLTLRRRELMLATPPRVLDSGKTRPNGEGKRARACTVYQHAQCVTPEAA